MRLAYFDCFSGVSGDMCLGALVSAGFDEAALASLPARLGLEQVDIGFSTVRRGPFAARRVEVTVPERQPHRHLRHIREVLDRGAIDPAVRDGAHRVFQRLAEAEAHVHGSTVENVHFHEVGAADALVDIVGTLEGLAALGIEAVHASTLRLGNGRVDSAHGAIPVPAPATTHILVGAPVEIGPVAAELTTPTGAALIATLVRRWGAPPPFRILGTGVGAGGRDLREQANVLRVIVGETEATPLAARRVAVLETAIDDDNPQHLAALVPGLLAHGALDAMLAPVQMKKGRPGLWLVVIAPVEQAEALSRVILTETTTLGVRVREEQRFELPRRAEEVETPFGPIAIKVATLPDGSERASPEFESARVAAERAGRPVREVAQAAVAAWTRGRS